MAANSQRDGGPLILGATGRIGQAFRRLAAGGLWPRKAPPLWHARRADRADPGDYIWDMQAGEAPRDDRLGRVRGLIVLTGGTGGATDPDQNTTLALAALKLAQREGIGPVLLCSSQAVYGRATVAQSESAATTPASPYGAAKLRMEQAVHGVPGVCCLRIGNVAGTDTLLRTAALGPLRLDRFPDGTAPRRCYIGPLSLARTMLELLDRDDLPRVLNVAAPGELAMDALLCAAGVGWDWQPAPPDALPALSLDLSLLQSLAPLPPGAGQAATLLAEARAAGWSAQRRADP